MSWDVTLYDTDGNECEVERFIDGGTYPVGGETHAELNITYNYGWFYYRCLDKEKGLKILHGMKAVDTIPLLDKAVKELRDDPYKKDYWAMTPGNAGHALAILLKWAEANPDAVFDVR